METKLIQVIAGIGPLECTKVVAQIVKKILGEAHGKGINTEVIFRERGGEKDTLLSAIIKLEGERLNSFLFNWIGTIKWVGKSQFKKTNQPKSWFVGVHEVMFYAEQLEVNESEIYYQTFRASGPGGQHVNKVETAVRAVHKPSGMRAYSQEHKSQFQNKKEAKRKLLNELRKKEMNSIIDMQRQTWYQQYELELENPIRTFEGSDFKSNHKKQKTRENRQREKAETRQLINK